MDFLQFPKQTLQYNGGDCDDLSILYASLFEAVGIETAFITIPGHIYTAFSLGITPDEALRLFQYPDELIFMGENTWVPLEVTSISDGFSQAWQIGAKQWRENNSRGQAGFYPVNTAWQTYSAVGFPEAVSITMPDLERIEPAYTIELEKFVNREIYSRATSLQARLTQSQGSPKIRNKLGVLYATYGLDDKAKMEFSKVIEETEYMPTLLNLGNLLFLEKDMDGAEEYYSRAEKLAPDNAKVVLSIAKVNHALENYGTAQKAYSKLKEIDPELAGRFAYLDFRGDESARASDIEIIKETVLWEEEE